MATRLWVLSSLMLIAGCGGKSPPPAATATPNAAASADFAEPTGPVPAAESTPPKSEPAGDTTASDASPSAPGTISTDGVDAECGKVAAPFEEKVRPLFNKCYQEGKKKNPDLSGVAKVAISVNNAGKVTAVKSAGTSELGDDVMNCIVKAVKAENFQGSSCKATTVTVSKEYGKKKKAAAAP